MKMVGSHAMADEIDLTGSPEYRATGGEVARVEAGASAGNLWDIGICHLAKLRGGDAAGERCVRWRWD